MDYSETCMIGWGLLLQEHFDLDFKCDRPTIPTCAF